ncbi:MAG TPA: hypothetical protein V6D19_07575 [Stenomitos sp.]
MAQKRHLLTDIALKGLAIAPSQVYGAIRIVPLLRSQVRGDLRLFKRSYQQDLTMVDVGDANYLAYVPHGLVMSWSNNGEPVAAYGGQFQKRDGKTLPGNCGSVKLLHRMVKREQKNELRFLPLHLAMEGFLSLFFKGPSIAWQDYSRYAKSHGLGSRWEWSVSGRAIAGLEDAIRIFEIHEGQVGVLLFVAETLASAFVVPTPEDYRALHRSLLEDFYGELIYQYACIYDGPLSMTCSINPHSVKTLADLRQGVMQMRADWAEFQGFMSESLLGRRLNSQMVYATHSFYLQRFITDLDPHAQNYIGEAIVRENGELEYLKTYCLSASQTKRVYLLSQLSAHNWNLAATATALHNTKEELVKRLEKVGFGYLLNPQVREQALKR